MERGMNGEEKEEKKRTKEKEKNNLSAVVIAIVHGGEGREERPVSDRRGSSGVVKAPFVEGLVGGQLEEGEGEARRRGGNGDS